jgi:hypothetical protein
MCSAPATIACSGGKLLLVWWRTNFYLRALLTHIPAALLQAITAEAGGRLALVIGAGCSIEPPTAIPLARELSNDAARKLVMDGVLEEGECANPGDLAALATLVFNKTGSQEALVSRFPLSRLRMAKANLGYPICVGTDETDISPASKMRSQASHATVSIGDRRRMS